MNRRSFFTKLGLAAASVAILPSAATYVRKWVKPNPSMGRQLWVVNTEWISAPYQLDFVWHSGAISVFKADTREIVGCLSTSRGGEMGIATRFVNDGQKFVRVDPFIPA
jgi:hypothetical protein